MSDAELLPKDLMEDEPSPYIAFCEEMESLVSSFDSGEFKGECLLKVHVQNVVISELVVFIVETALNCEDIFCAIECQDFTSFQLALQVLLLWLLYTFLIEWLRCIFVI